jgi:hypothetical protein
MNKFLSIALLLASVFLYAPSCAAQAETSAWTEGGLKKISVKGLDAVYAKPGASLAEYNKVLLRPISVSFQKNWERNVTSGTRMRLTAADSQRIKDKLSTGVREEVVKQLNDGGYKLVDSAGDDVLDVQMAIVNLYVTAPDVPVPGNVKTYAVSAGEMTLVLELRDSASGDVIARAFDRALASETFHARRITNADNAAEARQAASGWAKALRTALDRSKGIGAKP